MLQTALRDMQRVFPALSFAGLHVQFGNQTLPDSALAMHDPRTRTIQLSIATSGGTIAHELSHDLDWQAARRMFANGRGYSTDRAMRETVAARSRIGARARRGARDSRPGSGWRAERPGAQRPTGRVVRARRGLVRRVGARAARAVERFSHGRPGSDAAGLRGGRAGGVGTAGAESLLVGARRR